MLIGRGWLDDASCKASDLIAGVESGTTLGRCSYHLHDPVPEVLQFLQEALADRDFCRVDKVGGLK